MAIKIITTEDGSHSLLHEAMNETYHSTRGAIGESQHVFIREGLAYYLSQYAQPSISILEIGFGTGLNALLSTIYANESQQHIDFTTLEPYPIGKELYTQLNYHRSEDEKKLLLHTHEAEWGKRVELASFFHLTKWMDTLEAFESEKHFDVVYFDAFAPSKQPEVWALDNLRKCYELMRPGAILTTYCAQGKFKRNLAEVGFEIETLQGAMGKKEMVRALKLC